MGLQYMLQALFVVTLFTGLAYFYFLVGRGSDHVSSSHAAHEIEPMQTDPAPILRNSSYSCTRNSDWTDICQYELFCFGGEDMKTIYLVSDAIKEPIPWSIETGIESTFWDPSPMPPPLPNDRSPLPYHTLYLKGYWIPPSSLQWDQGDTQDPPEGRYNVHWLDGSLYYVSPETPGVNNLWHWSISVMNLWTVQYLNASKTGQKEGDAAYPSMDWVVVVGDTNVYNSWHYGLLEMVTQPHSKKAFLENLWVAGKPVWEGNGPQGRPNIEVNHRDTLICAKKAVMVGYKAGLFGGIAEAHYFREKVYKHFDIPLKEKVEEEEEGGGIMMPPKKALVIDRLEFEDRKWANSKHITRVLDDYDIPYEYVDDTTRHSFEEIVRRYASAGVTIMAHGAGMSNLMFQRPRSAVIEIFPYKGFQTMYRVLANHGRLFHFVIHNYVKHPSVVYANPGDEEKCRQTSLWHTFSSPVCGQPGKQSQVPVSRLALEEALVNAFQSIGHPVQPSSWLMSLLVNTTELT